MALMLEEDAQILRHLMERFGLTPPALAKRLGVDRTSITRILSGRRGIGRQMAERISACLAEELDREADAAAEPPAPAPVVQPMPRPQLRLEDLPDVLTVDEVAVVLRITPDAVYKYCRRGYIPHFRIGRRLFLRKQDIQRLIGGDRVV